jgi:NitT/TauT family transport system substrate-binding protein
MIGKLRLTREWDSERFSNSPGFQLSLWLMLGNDNCHSAMEEMIVMISTVRLNAKRLLLMVCFVILLVECLETSHAAQLDAVNLSYSALVPSGAPFWIAQELKLFEKEGLKTQMLYINAAPRVMAAILAGDVQISLSGVSPLVSAYAQGNDPVAIAGTVNQINVSVFARPEIRGAEDLRGKRIGITRFGGLTDFSAQYALKKWGLQPAKDVAVIQIGDASALMGAMAGNAIQAATLQPPSTILAAQLRYRELLDLSKSGLEYQNTVVLTTRSLLKRSPDMFRKFLRAYSAALAVFHKQKDTAIGVIARYLKGMDPLVLEKSYEAYRAWVPEIPYLNRPGMEAAIALTPAGGKEKEIRYSDIVDESMVRELEQQGFYRALYKK